MLGTDYKKSLELFVNAGNGLLEIHVLLHFESVRPRYSGGLQYYTLCRDSKHLLHLGGRPGMKVDLWLGRILRQNRYLLPFDIIVAERTPPSQRTILNANMPCLNARLHANAPWFKHASTVSQTLLDHSPTAQPPQDLAQPRLNLVSTPPNLS